MGSRSPFARRSTRVRSGFAADLRRRSNGPVDHRPASADVIGPKLTLAPIATPQCSFLEADMVSDYTLLSAARIHILLISYTFGGVAGSIPIAVITLLICINFLTFLSLLGRSIKGEIMMKNSKKVRKEKTETCDYNKATKHVRFYKRYIAQFIEITVSMSVSVMAAGSACLILFPRAVVRHSPFKIARHPVS